MKKYQNRYKKWHWGTRPTGTIEYDDPRLPENLIEIGKLWELIITPQRREYGKKGKGEFRINPDALSISPLEDDINNNYVLFDPDHRLQRIYFILSPDLQHKMKDHYTNMKVNPMPLSTLAMLTGGRQAQGDYPDVMVKPLGYSSHIAYYTHKKGDDPASPYMHEMGEGEADRKGNKVEGIEPMLGLSKDGSIWIAGGSYTCPLEGITN